MTLSTTLAKKTYDGDGSTTTFPTVFKFLQNSHVVATHIDAAGTETTWTEGTHYALTGAGSDSGGTVTVATSPADYTPASGEQLVLSRVVPETQEVDYPEGGAFPAATHEQALDVLTMMVQKHSEEIARALLVPIAEATASTIPGAAARAGKFLAFDGSGNPIASSGPAGDSSIPVSSYIETLLDDTDAAVARTTLGSAGTGANSFTGVQTLGSGASIDANDKEIGKPEIKDYSETVNAIGSIGGGTQDIDLEAGNVVTATVDTAATTFTFSNPPASGKAGSFTLFLTNGGSQTVNWPASVVWTNGNDPALTAAGTDILTFATLDGGMTWYGFLAGRDMQ